jgi:hypothetical protein
MATKKQITRAASNFLCEDDCYDAYQILCNAKENNDGLNLASNYVSIWLPLENITVDELLEIINFSIVEDNVSEKDVTIISLVSHLKYILSVVNPNENIITFQYRNKLNDIIENAEKLIK